MIHFIISPATGGETVVEDEPESGTVMAFISGDMAVRWTTGGEAAVELSQFVNAIKDCRTAGSEGPDLLRAGLTPSGWPAAVDNVVPHGTESCPEGRTTPIDGWEAQESYL
jgi:hypothetical protein